MDLDVCGVIVILWGNPGCELLSCLGAKVQSYPHLADGRGVLVCGVHIDGGEMGWDRHGVSQFNSIRFVLLCFLCLIFRGWIVLRGLAQDVQHFFKIGFWNYYPRLFLEIFGK